MAVTNDAGKYIGSEMWSRPIAAAESSSGLWRYLCSHLPQARWSSKMVVSGLAVVVAGVKLSSSDNKWLLNDRQYGLKADSGQNIPQFAF
jgi:hypothetical protein